MIFGTYKLHNAENEIMLSLCHYVNSYSPEGATNMSILSICIIAVLLICYIETVHSFCIHLVNKKIVCFCCLVVFISTLLFCK